MHIADYIFLREFEFQYLRLLLNRVKTEIQSVAKGLFIEVSALERIGIQSAIVNWAENLAENCKNNLTVLIHNGDQIPDQTFYVLLVSIGITVYSVNCTEEYPGVKALPIGLENRHLRGNGIGKKFSICNENYFHLNAFVDRRSDVFTSFNLHTNFAERINAKGHVLKCGYEFTEPNLSRRKYQACVRRSRFVISPPGNGIDCHRTWEAIYLGSVPVVLKKYISHELIRLFPIIAVNKWEDFFELSSSEKDVLVSQFDGVQYPAMSIDFWNGAIRRSVEL